jgi:hypothetical protein
MGNCIELDCIVLQSRKRAVLLQGTLYFSKLSKEKYRFREMASIYFDSDPTEHLQAHIQWNRRRIQLELHFWFTFTAPEISSLIERKLIVKMTMTHDQGSNIIQLQKLAIRQNCTLWFCTWIHS